jgi:hypothetical protein
MDTFLVVVKDLVKLGLGCLLVGALASLPILLTLSLFGELSAQSFVFVVVASTAAIITATATYGARRPQ